MKTASALLVVCLTAATVHASVDPPLDLEKHTRGATKVVLATVTDVGAAFGENAYGDQLILSRLTMRVDETLKGAHEAALVVILEGGTVGGVTLDVSDMPKLGRGQRAVLFLTSSPSGGYVPYGRGRGVVKVGADNRADGADLTIDDIRAAVAAEKARGGR